ncbi:MAG: hypothetical protein DRJ03_10075 [Chloroflexi bacterium]|nr:MAG: hypothetical protein DRJ03_10075 [Chloroflexota bacterium]
MLLVLLIFIAGTAVAWQENWKWFMKTTGMVKKAEVTWEPVIINLGELYAGQEFIASTTVEITSTCVNVSVTNIVMVIEYAYTATYKEAERYLEECFVNLIFNITINGNTTTVPIILNGKFNDQSLRVDPHWEYLNTSAGYPYYITVGFPSYEIYYGKQTAYVVVYGQAGYPDEDLIFGICWYLEITPGTKNVTTTS